VASDLLESPGPTLVYVSTVKLTGTHTEHRDVGTGANPPPVCPCRVHKPLPVSNVGPRREASGEQRGGEGVIGARDVRELVDLRLAIEDLRCYEHHTSVSGCQL
jgi:hypothetical protein